MNRDRLGSFISSRRKEMGLARKDVATRMGVGIETFKSYELGRIAPGLDKLFKLAEILEVEPKVIFEELEETIPGQLEDHTEKYISLPYDFPAEDQRQVELFVQFLQYQNEFQDFIELTKPRNGKLPTREEVDNLVDKIRRNYKNSENQKEIS